MSFPINENCTGSLFFNYSLKVQENFGVAPQSIEFALQLIEKLGEMVPFNPGTIGELEPCFRRMYSTSDNPQSASAVHSIRRSIITSRVVARSRFPNQSDNLKDALLLLEDKKPSISRLFPLLKKIVETTFLITPYDESWRTFTDTVYSARKKTENDYVCLKEFEEIFERESERKNCERRRSLDLFYLENERTQCMRSGLQRVRAVFDSSAKLRVQEILNEVTLNSMDHVKQVALLQLLCSVLWMEHELSQQLEKFHQTLMKLLPEKLPNVPTESHSKSFERDNQMYLQTTIEDLFPAELKDELLNYVEAKFKFCSNLKSPKLGLQDAWNASPKSYEIFLELVEEFGKQICASEVPAHFDHLKLQWKELNRALVQSLKHISVKYCVYYAFRDLAYTFTSLYNFRNNDNLLAISKILHVLSPAFWLIKERFLILWSEFVNENSAARVSLEEQLEGIEIVHRTVHLSNASRDEIYRELRSVHLRKLQKLRETPKTTLELRRNLFSFDEAKSLPLNLDAQAIANICKSEGADMPTLFANAAKSTSKRVLKSQARAARLKDESAASLSESSASSSTSTAQTALVARERKPLNLSLWKSSIDYAPRVSRWFDATYRLQREEFPEYWEGDKEWQNLMIRLHRHLPMADFFFQRGIELPLQVQWGKNNRRFAVPAELTFEGKTQSGILLWAFNEQNVCYHRFFHRKLDRDSDQFMKTLEQAIDEECASVATSTSSHAHETVQLVFDAKNSANTIEIDELLGMATLTSQQYSSLALKVFFMKF